MADELERKKKELQRQIGSLKASIASRKGQIKADSKVLDGGEYLAQSRRLRLEERKTRNSELIAQETTKLSQLKAELRKLLGQ